MQHFEAGLWHRGTPVVLTPSENAGAGKEWYVDLPTVPEGVYYRPKSIRYRFSATAAAPVRSLGVEYANGGGEYYLRTFTGLNIGPNIVVDAMWIEAPTAVQVNRGGTPNPAEHQYPLPLDWRLPGGHRIRSNTFNLDVGDVYAGVQVFCERYIYQPPAQQVAAVEALNRTDVVSLRESIERLATVVLDKDKSFI